MDQNEFETRMNERLANLATELRDRDQIANQLRLQIDQRIDSHFTQLQTEILRELRTGVENHRTHISSLYQKFERSIWAALVVFGAVFAFFGITQWTYIPNKINDAIETPLNEVKNRLTTKVEGLIDDMKKEIKDGVDSLNLAETRKRISDADGDVERLATDAGEAITVWRQFVETEAKRATEDATRKVEEISTTYTQELTRLLIEDGLLFLGGRSVTDANVLRLLNLREDFQDQDHLRFLQAIETERLVSATEGVIRAYLEQFEEQVPTLKVQFEDEFKVPLGLRFEVQSVVKSLADDLQSENREQILKAFEILNVPEVACAESRRFRRSGPSFVAFREQLIKLLEDPDAVVSARSFFAFLEFRSPTPLEVFTVTEFIRGLDSEEEFETLTQGVECLPAHKGLLAGLVLAVEAAPPFESLAVAELAAATGSYIIRHSEELNPSLEDLEGALRVLQSRAGTLAEANATVEAIQSLVVELQREEQFTESPHFVNITDDELDLVDDLRTGYNPNKEFSDPEEFIECPIRIIWFAVNRDARSLKLTGTISSETEEAKKTKEAKFELIIRDDGPSGSRFVVHEGRIAIGDGIWLGAKLSPEEGVAIRLFLRFSAPNS